MTSLIHTRTAYPMISAMHSPFVVPPDLLASPLLTRVTIKFRRMSEGVLAVGDPATGTITLNPDVARETMLAAFRDQLRRMFADWGYPPAAVAVRSVPGGDDGMG